MKNEKPMEINPLQLDKETIAKLDEMQLQEIAGGVGVESVGVVSCGGVGNSCAAGTSCQRGGSC
ncbi:class I lanthipeptide [Mucilaginibacter sp. CAU 1740]|uniref:Uncharacterized protein n=1 Tax=Mucilaginibacter oryzae TaxID=468058 RepID=A0A316H053_9SPHI|nr:class I lanthipeptide [Mucilaginibacter oryzae]PWK70828.1 hypothetical protein LX99_04535 [Mucilaginibacter oryzae]